MEQVFAIEFNPAECKIFLTITKNSLIKYPYTAQYNKTYFERIRLSVKEMFGSNPVRMAPVEMEVRKTIQTI